MEYQHLITVGILLGLAIFGLIVGVSNDAANFMNSAVGSGAARRNVIVAIAGIGIFAGVLFSSEMMEVARKSIFNPQHFVLEELLVIFLAVMLQNILLLDLYNTFGLPTSTTVSVVFGLFGGAFAVAALKVWEAELPAENIFMYIESAKVALIISAIFISIFIAFIVGSITQYITRFIFTFEYKKRFKRYGSIWGGIALTVIIYFILIKGAKGSPMITEETIQWINTHTLSVVLICFGACTTILQLLMWFTKINILRVIVLTGTFALAMAFAANDLVNFIGAPIAGLEAYKLADAAGNSAISMGGLQKEIPANIYILITSGVIMIFTLFLSKKARTVTKTEISLSRQEEGFERFESYGLSRMIVRSVIVISDFLKKVMPQSLQKKLAARFDHTKFKPETNSENEVQAYDLLRASVNLMVAAGLISYATSHQLPLSTTYVTFIVAMATALPDKSWGRESAVYRISGVLTVVGGWFFTAILATIAAMIIAVILYFGGFAATLGLLALTVYAIYHSSKLHKLRDKEMQEEEEKDKKKTEFKTPHEALEYVFQSVGSYFSTVDEIITLNYKGLGKQSLKQLKKARKKSKKLKKQSNVLVADVLKVLRFANDEDLKQGHIFASPLGALHEITDRLRTLSAEIYEYFDNNHHPFLEEQVNELSNVNKAFSDMFCRTAKTIRNKFNDGDKGNDDDYKEIRNHFLEVLKVNNKNQIKRIQASESNKRRSILYLNILDGTRVIADNSVVIADSCDKFYKLVKTREDERAGTEIKLP